MNEYMTCVDVHLNICMCALHCFVIYAHSYMCMCVDACMCVHVHLCVYKKQQTQALQG